MSNSTNKLQIALGANTKGLKTDLARAKGEFGKAFRAMKGELQGANLGGLVMGGLAGFSLGGMLNKMGEASDNFQRLKIATKTSDADFGALKSQVRALNSELGLMDMGLAGEKLQMAAMYSGQTGEALKILTLNAARLTHVFPAMKEEMTLKAQSMFMRAFGASALESADAMAYLGSLGGDLRDEMGESVLEYGAQFKEAGFNISDMIGVLKEATQGGWSVDKVADAFKEGRLKLLGQDTATVNALQALGLKDLAGQIKSGEATAAQAMAQIYTKLKGQNQNEQLRLGKDIFGAPFEDAGVAVMLKALNAMGKSPNIKGASAKLGAELSKSFGFKWKQMLSGLGGMMTGLFDALGPKLLPVINWLSRGVAKISAFIEAYPNLVSAVTLGLVGLGSTAVLFSGMSVGLSLLKLGFAGLFGPISFLAGLFGWWIIPIGLAIWGLAKLEEQTGWISGAFSALGSGISLVLGPAFNEIKVLGEQAWGALVDLLGMFGVEMGKGKGLSEGFKSFFVGLGKVVGFVINTLFLDPLRFTFQTLISIRDLFVSIKNLFTHGFSLEGLKAVFIDLARVVGNVFMTILSAMPGASLFKAGLSKALAKLGAKEGGEVLGKEAAKDALGYTAKETSLAQALLPMGSSYVAAKSGVDFATKDDPRSALPGLGAPLMQPAQAPQINIYGDMISSSRDAGADISRLARQAAY